jgi:hypothetical protein
MERNYQQEFDELETIYRLKKENADLTNDIMNLLQDIHYKLPCKNGSPSRVLNVSKTIKVCLSVGYDPEDITGFYGYITDNCKEFSRRPVMFKYFVTHWKQVDYSRNIDNIIHEEEKMAFLNILNNELPADVEKPTYILNKEGNKIA